MQTRGRSLRFDQIDVRVVYEHALVVKTRVADDDHVFLDAHVLVAADQRALDHVVAHAMDAEPALLGHAELAQVGVVPDMDLAARCARLQKRERKALCFENLGVRAAQLRAHLAEHEDPR